MRKRMWFGLLGALFAWREYSRKQKIDQIGSKNSKLRGNLERTPKFGSLESTN